MSFSSFFRVSARQLAAVALLLVGFAALTAPARAAYPERPITLIVPFPAGGNSDIVARLIGEHMSEVIGQPVVVSNRSGAGGLIGNQALVRAEPDGYTLLLGGMSTQILLAGTTPDLPYDPVEDFSAVALISSVPLVLAVPASSPADDLQAFVEYLRKSPGAYNFSSAGTGTSGHVTAQYFANAVGAEVVHVLYRGSAAALVDLFEGRNAYLVDTPPVLREHVRAGRVRALASFTEERLADLPEVPTIEEAGLGDEIEQMMQPWQAIFAPAGTPPEVEARIHEAVQSALADESLRARLTELGLIPEPASLEDAKQRFTVDYEQWLPIVREMVSTAG